MQVRITRDRIACSNDTAASVCYKYYAIIDDINNKKLQFICVRIYALFYRSITPDQIQRLNFYVNLTIYDRNPRGKPR